MDTIQNYKCPCCTAPLVFDAEKQKLLCPSCNNTFAIETIEQLGEGDEAAKAESRYDWDSYTPRKFEDTSEINLADYSCPSCGAEISGDDTLGATVCPYCGNSTIVQGQFEGGLKPDYIIPFKLDKKAAMTAFEKAFKNAPFIPDSFKNKKKIEEMAGVYVPFWSFDCTCDAAISYTAEKITAWSDANYDYCKTDCFKLFRSGSISFANLPVDGSKKADSAFMEAVEPFDYNEAVDFSCAYLSGYLADKYDISAEDSIERANERVKNSAIKAFGDTTNRYTAVIPESSSVSFSGGKIRYSLLPVWMLNIKYMDKMYKFAINGQTGKVVGEYPIDSGKKWKYFGAVAAVGYMAAAVLAYLLLH